MTLKEAIKILKTHNAWRRWDGIGPSAEMQSPYKIGQAIDCVVANYEKREKTKDSAEK